MTSGGMSRWLVADGDRAGQRRLGPAEPGFVVGQEFGQRLALLDPLPRLGQADARPAAGLTGSSLTARPAPSRQAATPTARASSRCSQPILGAGSTGLRCRAAGSGASGSPPWARIIAR